MEIQLLGLFCATLAVMFQVSKEIVYSVGDTGGAVYLRTQIVSISCSSSENLAKLHFRAPWSVWRLSSMANPGSVPAVCESF